MSRGSGDGYQSSFQVFVAENKISLSNHKSANGKEGSCLWTLIFVFGVGGFGLGEERNERKNKMRIRRGNWEGTLSREKRG